MERVDISDFRSATNVCTSWTAPSCTATTRSRSGSTLRAGCCWRCRPGELLGGRRRGDAHRPPGQARRCATTTSSGSFSVVGTGELGRPACARMASSSNRPPSTSRRASRSTRWTRLTDDAPVIRLVNSILDAGHPPRRIGHPFRSRCRRAPRHLPRRRHARQRADRSAATGKRDHQPPEADGQRGHLREAQAAGRPHGAAHRRSPRSTCGW